MRRVALVALAALAAFVALTAVALEAGSVAVVTTASPGAPAHETHVWFARIGGSTWLEAGAPQNAWFVDAQAQPRIRLALPSEPSSWVIATPLRDAESQRRVRAALRAKYGWRDAWVGMLVDASRSVAVRIDPAPGP